jgi:hypothetical protein
MALVRGRTMNRFLTQRVIVAAAFYAGGRTALGRRERLEVYGRRFSRLKFSVTLRCRPGAFISPFEPFGFNSFPQTAISPLPLFLARC